MKRNVIFILSMLVVLAACDTAKKKEQKEGSDSTKAEKKAPEKKEPSLVLKWTSDTTLKTCESVLYDKNKNILYVSNIDGEPLKKDKNGFIAKVSANDGKIEKLKWITGLDAPKGLGILNGKLYVTDITALAEIDIEKGKLLKKYEVPGAKFLNDVAVGSDGTIYFSDSETGKVHTFKDGKIDLFKDGFKGPNGLLVQGNKLFLTSMGSNDLKVIDLGTKKDSVIATGIAAGDGLVYSGKEGEYFVSDWNGQIFNVQDGKAKQILDTKKMGLNTADIEFIQDNNLLLVPTFSGNAVHAYVVKFYNE